MHSQYKHSRFLLARCTCVWVGREVAGMFGWKLQFSMAGVHRIGSSQRRSLKCTCTCVSLQTPQMETWVEAMSTFSTAKERTPSGFVFKSSCPQCHPRFLFFPTFPLSFFLFLSRLNFWNSESFKKANENKMFWPDSPFHQWRICIYRVIAWASGNIH